MRSSRRAFLHGTCSCAAHIALAGALLPPLARSAWAARPGGRVVAAEPFGRLESVAPGVWALISTPLTGDRTTLSNGGLIAGTNGVLAIEGFMMPAGARWLADQAVALTGMRPSHVVLSHYHADHVNGVAGFTNVSGTPVTVHATRATLDLARERNQPADPDRTRLLDGATVIAPTGNTTLDLGGRQITITPHAGHTASDVIVTVDDTIFCGDLVWNAMFPNYMDTVPSALAATVRALRSQGAARYVPGHGSMSAPADLDRYLSMLESVERAARASRGRGQSAAEAATAYRFPEALGEWMLFSPRFLEVAFQAWYRELGGA
ncbi:MAG: MBL fold metallo-hydrolase [Gemmatimonadales bacterium]|nr:MBL fold metallo-hydrolase [Gemmatimonadales bacterium]